MKYQDYILPRITTAFQLNCPELVNGLQQVMQSDLSTMRNFARNVNKFLDSKIRELNPSASTLNKAVFCLSIPENQDAWTYWIDDITSTYIEAYREAKRNENNS